MGGIQGGYQQVQQTQLKTNINTKAINNQNNQSSSDNAIAPGMQNNKLSGSFADRFGLDNLESKCSVKSGQTNYNTTGGGGGGNDGSDIKSGIEDIANTLKQGIDALGNLFGKSGSSSSAPATTAQLNNYDTSSAQKALTDVNNAISDWGDTINVGAEANFTGRTEAKWNNLGTTGNAAHAQANTLSSSIKSSQAEMSSKGVEVDQCVDDLLDNQSQLEEAQGRVMADSAAAQADAQKGVDDMQQVQSDANDAVDNKQTEVSDTTDQLETAKDDADQQAIDAGKKLQTLKENISGQKTTVGELKTAWSSADTAAKSARQAANAAAADDPNKASLEKAATEAETKAAQAKEKYEIENKKLGELEKQLPSEEEQKNIADKAAEAADKTLSEYKTTSQTELNSLEATADAANTNATEVQNAAQQAVQTAKQNEQEVNNALDAANLKAKEALDGQHDFKTQVAAMEQKNRVAADLVNQLNNRGNRAIQLKNESSVDKGLKESYGQWRADQDTLNKMNNGSMKFDEAHYRQTVANMATMASEAQRVMADPNATVADKELAQKTLTAIEKAKGYEETSENHIGALDKELGTNYVQTFKSARESLSSGDGSIDAQAGKQTARTSGLQQANTKAQEKATALADSTVTSNPPVIKASSTTPAVGSKGAEEIKTPAEAPKAEAPKTQEPQGTQGPTDAPKVDTPAADDAKTPTSADSPKESPAASDAPKVDTPPADSPKVKEQAEATKPIIRTTANGTQYRIFSNGTVHDSNTITSAIVKDLQARVANGETLTKGEVEYLKQMTGKDYSVSVKK